MSEKITDSYFTIASRASYEFKVKGSRFIGIGVPVENEDDALTALNDIRKKEFSATHHCYAYTVGIESEKFKYSDDGEPNGTAGRPIYNAIVGRKIQNILVVVVRYYGGTKLGTGGLTRAYTQATIDMLNKANIVEKLICEQLSFSIPFSFYDRMMRIINAGKFTILSQDFAEEVSMEIEIRKSKVEQFITEFIEITGGKIEIERNG